MYNKIRLNLRRTVILLSAVSVLAVFCPFTAGARDFEVDDHQAAFTERFDQDGDGLVSLDEFPGPDPIFDELDTDGDGYLNTAEVPAEPPHHGGPPPRDLLAELDTDGDDLISLSEFDADGDGYISEDEARRPHDDIDGARLAGR